MKASLVKTLARHFPFCEKSLKRRANEGRKLGGQVELADRDGSKVLY